MTFLVGGITGKVGGATARNLLASGHSVRAICRDPAKAAQWASQGVDVRPGDLADAAAVAAALDGCEGAFLLIPPTMAPSPDFREAKAVIQSYKEALAAAPPRRLVLLSSIGSEKPSGLGLITATSLMEAALGDLPLPTAFLRAGGFMENYVYALHMATSVTPGSFSLLMAPTDRPFPFIATADIGAEAARLLMDGGWSEKKIIELGSPMSPDDLAAAIAEVLGRPVRAAAVPRDQWTAGLERQGFPAGGTGAYEEMSEGINSGWIAFGVPGTEAVAAKTTPKEVYAAAWQAMAAQAAPQAQAQ